eukprot:428860-Pyramimonas_sp.AAC.1
MEGLVESRKKVVEIARKEDTRVKENVRAIAMDKWKEKYPDSKPHEEGHIVKKLVLPGRGLTECVCLRTLPEGEYDAEIA